MSGLAFLPMMKQVKIKTNPPNCHSNAPGPKVAKLIHLMCQLGKLRECKKCIAKKQGTFQILFCLSTSQWAMRSGGPE